jgi:CubicO group peptidase (beta-lactamase class C family)
MRHDSSARRSRTRRWWRWLLVVAVAVAVLAGATWVGLALSTSRSQLARSVVWGESDMDDHRRFPARPVAAGPDRFDFRRPAGGSDVPPPGCAGSACGTATGGSSATLEQFLDASDTTAFLIVKGDTLLYEGYFNGAGHDSVQTSMSIAKSVLSALVGIAIGEGRIGSVDDPITRYVPELAERDPRFGQVTLRHLLSMTSGLRYEETGTPWGDDTATYYGPDLRALALKETEIAEAPGRRFHYNNFNPLVGLALERATGTPVATYLERKLWQPLGMEADGSWSLDSEASGFEKMESGLNARAVDFARFGLLFAREGAWRGRQLVPRAGWGMPPWCRQASARCPLPATGSSGGSRTTAARAPSSPGASTPSTSMWCQTAIWSWSASAATPATRTGRSCSATSPGDSTRQPPAGRPDLERVQLKGASAGQRQPLALPHNGEAGVSISPARARVRSRAACQHHTSDVDGLWEATVEDDGGRRWLGGEAALGGLLLLLGTLVLVG